MGWSVFRYIEILKREWTVKASEWSLFIYQGIDESVVLWL